MIISRYRSVFVEFDAWRRRLILGMGQWPYRHRVIHCPSTEEVIGIERLGAHCFILSRMRNMARNAIKLQIEKDNNGNNQLD